MATATYNPREPVMVTMSYREILDLRALVEHAIDHWPSQRLHERQPGISAVNAMARAVYPDMQPLTIWCEAPCEHTDPDALTRGDDLHQDAMAAHYDTYNETVVSLESGS